jgi:hypothetical protein
MSNLSILQRNIVHGLDCEDAETVFFRACAVMPALKAEKIAYEYRNVSRFLDFALPIASANCGVEVPHDLRSFIRERYWHWARTA